MHPFGQGKPDVARMDDPARRHRGPRSRRNVAIDAAIAGLGVADSFTSSGIGHPAVSITISTSEPADVLQKYTRGSIPRCEPRPARRFTRPSRLSGDRLEQIGLSKAPERKSASAGSGVRIPHGNCCKAGNRGAHQPLIPGSPSVRQQTRNRSVRTASSSGFAAGAGEPGLLVSRDHVVCRPR